jgi:hypothetical protein
MASDTKFMTMIEWEGRDGYRTHDFNFWDSIEDARRCREDAWNRSQTSSRKAVSVAILKVKVVD